MTSLMTVCPFKVITRTHLSHETPAVEGRLRYSKSVLTASFLISRVVFYRHDQNGGGGGRLDKRRFVAAEFEHTISGYSSVPALCSTSQAIPIGFYSLHIIF